jgi:hypothetical protein
MKYEIEELICFTHSIFSLVSNRKIVLFYDNGLKGSLLKGDKCKPTLHFIPALRLEL